MFNFTTTRINIIFRNKSYCVISSEQSLQSYCMMLLDKYRIISWTISKLTSHEIWAVTYIWVTRIKIDINPGLFTESAYSITVLTPLSVIMHTYKADNNPNYYEFSHARSFCLQ
jgi:hypothetical protein